jgi:hypothetical protein
VADAGFGREPRREGMFTRAGPENEDSHDSKL